MTSLRRLDLSQNRNLRYISRSAFVDVEALSSLVLTDSGLDTMVVAIVVVVGLVVVVIVVVVVFVF